MRGGVRKRGQKWYYYFDDVHEDGSRKKVERVAGDTKEQAEKKLTAILNEINTTGRYFLGTNMRVNEYMHFWMENYVKMNLKYNTQQNYKFTISKHINPYLGSKKIKNLTPALLQEFINYEFKQGFAKKTLTIVHSVLKNALNMAVYPWGLLKENPMIYVKVPRFQVHSTTKKDLKIISLDTFDKINNFISPTNSFYIPLQLGFYTGMRVSEVCGLTWDNVDLQEGKIYVEKILVNHKGKWVFGTPKTKSSKRTIFIGQTLINILKQHRKVQSENRIKYADLYHDSNFVCTKENGESVTPSSAKSSTRKISKDLDISFNFHSLRHTHATLLLENGAKMKEIQERLGHSRISVTMDTYSHVTDKMRNETVDIMERLRQKNS